MTPEQAIKEIRSIYLATKPTEAVKTLEKFIEQVKEIQKYV